MHNSPAIGDMERENMSSCDALILVEVSKAYFEMVPRDYLNTPRSNFLPQQPIKEHF